MDEKLERFLGLPNEAERAAAKVQSEAKLRELFEIVTEHPPGVDLIRSLVGGEEWFVPTAPDGTFELKEIKPGKYKPAIETSGPKGRGGWLLPVHSEKPECSCTTLDGRALARSIPDRCAGLALHLLDRAPRELGREHFQALIVLADAFDLEESLLNPAAGQIEQIKNALWWVQTYKDEIRIDSAMDHGRLINAFTHRDRPGYGWTTVKQISVEELFTELANNEAVDGVSINYVSQLGRGANILHGLAFSPGFAANLLEGKDIRPGAAPLPARSRAELELWLAIRRFPYRDRKLVDAPYPDKTLVRAMLPESDSWRMQEALGNQSPLDAPTWSPVFILPPGKFEKEPTAALEELGEGPTQILCAGLMAKELGAAWSTGADPARHWRPGRSYLFARKLEDYELAESRRRWAIARELHKLLPEGENRIPRRALLTVEGANLAHEHPHALTRAWIEATLQQAEKYTTRWVR